MDLRAQRYLDLSVVMSSEPCMKRYAHVTYAAEMSLPRDSK